MPEGARAELSRPLVPANNLTGGKQLHHGINLAIFSIVQRVARLAVVQDVFDVLFAEFWPPKYVRRRLHPRLAGSAVPCQLGRSQCATAVARGRRDRNLPNSQSLLQIGNQKRVLEHAATQTNILDALLLAQALQPVANQFGTCLLQTRRQHLLLVLADFTGIGGKSKLPKEFSRERKSAGQTPRKETEINSWKRSIRTAEHLEKNIFKIRTALQAQPLGLVFLFTRNETNKISDQGIDPGQRMREGNRAQHTDAGALADRHHP